MHTPENDPQSIVLGPEMVVGLIGAVGTDMQRVTETLRLAFDRVNYEVREVHAIELLEQFRRWNAGRAFLGEEYPGQMDAGNAFREAVALREGVALLAMSAIRRERLLADGQNTPLPRTVYLIRSLKTPEEVALLREVYGKSFLALAAYAPREARRAFLRQKVVGHGADAPEGEALEAMLTDLLSRDEAEPENRFGQNVEATFPLADFFVDASVGEGELRHSIFRIVELFFGNLFHAPTRDEYGMFHAVTAGVRSTSLARQVGASICTPDGELIALGCNDVPKAGGGLYWEGDEGDSRDHLRGYDFNDQMKHHFLRDILERLRESGWLEPGLRALEAEALFERALEPGSSLRHSELMKVIEYGRSVHAEMAALMDAAKRGIPVEGCTLYTTTFPCHNCAKHIVASGLRRVVYVEPYPKSFTKRLFSDSIWVDGAGELADPGRAVRFEPFVGISFRQYFSLFSVGNVERKVNGSLTQWVPEVALPRYYEHPFACLARERNALGRLEQRLHQAGLEPVATAFWSAF